MTDTALNVMGKYYTIFGNKLMFPMFSNEYRYTHIENLSTVCNHYKSRNNSLCCFIMWSGFTFFFGRKSPACLLYQSMLSMFSVGTQN